MGCLPVVDRRFGVISFGNCLALISRSCSDKKTRAFVVCLTLLQPSIGQVAESCTSLEAEGVHHFLLAYWNLECSQWTFPYFTQNNRVVGSVSNISMQS